MPEGDYREVEFFAMVRPQGMKKHAVRTLVPGGAHSHTHPKSLQTTQITQVVCLRLNPVNLMGFRDWHARCFNQFSVFP